MIGHLFQSPALISFRLFRNTLPKILGNTNRISCAFSRVLQKILYDFSTVYFRATLNSNFPTSFALFIFQCTTAVLRQPNYITTTVHVCQQKFKHFLTFETIVQSNFKF